MQFPTWVQQSIDRFAAPPTGKVVITLECYQGGISRLEIGGFIRVENKSQAIQVQTQAGRLGLTVGGSIPVPTTPTQPIKAASGKLSLKRF